jgi:hypothetical protein
MPKNVINPDPLSFTTHHLHIGFNNEVLSHGTGFIYKKEENYYLITNWHIVSGKHPDTGAHLSADAGEPNVVCTYFRDRDNPGSTHKEIIRLYADDDMQKPIWKEHPLHKSKVDVVAIPLQDTITNKYGMFPINDIQFDSEYKEEVADEAFVIGYPFAEPTYIALPIWKKASISSEPDVNINQLPMMYIDSATRSGLSGSPVIMQRIGVHGLVGGVLDANSSVGRIRNFIGIYSGRLGDDEFKAQLGIVWKAKVIEEILA